MYNAYEAFRGSILTSRPFFDVTGAHSASGDASNGTPMPLASSSTYNRSAEDIPINACSDGKAPAPARDESDEFWLEDKPDGGDGRAGAQLRAQQLQHVLDCAPT